MIRAVIDAGVSESLPLAVSARGPSWESLLGGRVVRNGSRRVAVDLVVDAAAVLRA